MKKNSLVNGLLLLFLLLSSTVTYANNGQRITLGNWENPMTMQTVDFGHIMTVLLPESHLLHVNLKIRTARTTYNENPDFYLGYTFGQYEDLLAGPFTMADFTGTFMYDENGNFVLDNNGDPIELLEMAFPLFLDFSDNCTYEADRNGIFEIPVEISLLMRDKNGSFIPYPIMEHPLLFPLNLFEETTFPYPLPLFEADKYVDCDNWPGPEPINRVAAEAAEQEASETEFTLLPEGVHPNPFVDQFSLVYRLEKAEKVHLRLIDSRGKVVYEKQNFYKEAGLHEEILELAELLPGLYFIQWSTSNDLKTSSAVKL